MAASSREFPPCRSSRMPLPRSVQRAPVMDTLVLWLDVDQGDPLGAPLALQVSHCTPA